MLYRCQNQVKMKEKKGEIMLNNWDAEDFQKALSNYEHMLKERPGDAELLRNYQMISLEYEKYKKEEGKILCPVETLNGEYPKYCPWCGNKLSI